MQNASPLQCSQQNQCSTTTAAGTETKPKKKICCACPDTKRLRDECIVEHGESACAKWIEAHKMCLRAEGFNVWNWWAIKGVKDDTGRIIEVVLFMKLIQVLEYGKLFANNRCMILFELLNKEGTECLIQGIINL